ncbi:MAG: CcmD family protein [Acidobacteriota bacterium]
MNAYLFAGYVVIWTILFVFLLYLNRRQRSLGEQLKSLDESTRRGKNRPQASGLKPQA